MSRCFATDEFALQMRKRKAADTVGRTLNCERRNAQRNLEIKVNFFDAWTLFLPELKSAGNMILPQSCRMELFAYSNENHVVRLKVHNSFLTR